MRVVSLLPSATEILFAIGAGDQVVGVTFECDHPPEARTRRIVSTTAIPEGLSSNEIDAFVTKAMHAGEDLYHLDAGALAELDADLVVTQDLCAVCAVDVSKVDDALDYLGCRAEVLTIDPHTLDEVLDSIATLGEATDTKDRAEALVRSLHERLAAVAEVVAGQEKPRALVLEWTDPPFAPGHWVPEMVAAAGGTSSLGLPGEKSQRTRGHRRRPLRIPPRGSGDPGAEDDRRRGAAPRHTGVGGGRERLLRPSRTQAHRRRRGAGRHLPPRYGGGAEAVHGPAPPLRPARRGGPRRYSTSEASRSARVSTPTGLPSSTTMIASAVSSSRRASAIGWPAPTSGRAGSMSFSTESVRCALPAKSLSSSDRSLTAPATSPAITGGSALTTGIWETPYSCRISMASRTVSGGWVCTRAGRSPAFLCNTSPTVASPAAFMNP